MFRRRSTYQPNNLISNAPVSYNGSFGWSTCWTSRYIGFDWNPIKNNTFLSPWYPFSKFNELGEFRKVVTAISKWALFIFLTTSTPNHYNIQFYQFQFVFSLFSSFCWTMIRFVNCICDVSCFFYLIHHPYDLPALACDQRHDIHHIFRLIRGYLVQIGDP